MGALRPLFAGRARLLAVAAATGVAVGPALASRAGTPTLVSTAATTSWALLVCVSTLVWLRLRPVLGAFTALAAICVAWAALAVTYAGIFGFADPELHVGGNVVFLAGSAALGPATAALLVAPVVLAAKALRGLVGRS